MLLNVAKVLYHRLIPASVRNPFGAWRRELLRRMRREPSVPPAEILQRIQATASASEYFSVGQRAAQAVIRVLQCTPGSTPRLLDLGCGPARVLRHLPQSWGLTGADEFDDAIAWSSGHVHGAKFVKVNLGSQLPFDDQAFSVVLAVSLFPGLEPARRAAVALEAARVVEHGGLLIVSTPGAAVLAAFDPDASMSELKRRGVVRTPGGPSVFTPRGLDQLLSAHFEPVLWEEQGLDGFQDLFVYRRR